MISNDCVALSEQKFARRLGPRASPQRQWLRKVMPFERDWFCRRIGKAKLPCVRPQVDPGLLLSWLVLVEVVVPFPRISLPVSMSSPAPGKRRA